MSNRLHLILSLLAGDEFCFSCFDTISVTNSPFLFTVSQPVLLILQFTYCLIYHHGISWDPVKELLQPSNLFHGKGGPIVDK